MDFSLARANWRANSPTFARKVETELHIWELHFYKFDANERFMLTEFKK